MLVLKRHEQEVITVRVPPSDRETLIEVMLVEIFPMEMQARIGIDAPREVGILRDDAIVKGPKTSAGQRR